MKVFAYAGSMRGQNSNTYKVIRSIMDYLQKDSECELEESIYTAAGNNIEMCRGCGNCFNTGYCILDKKDDMERLKNDMEAADIILFGSPVYIHQISGPAKNVIDRLSYWSYLFKLAGKICITISSSNTNGNTFVDNYLTRIFQIMGASVIKNASLKFALMTEKEIDTVIQECVLEIKRLYHHKSELSVAPMQEELFALYKNGFSTVNFASHGKTYWTENKLFEFNSFKELLETAKARNEKPESICF